MGEEKAEKPADPFSQWVDFWDNWAKSWSAAMSDTVTSKSFADSMGQQMESSLESMGLVRRQVNGMMEQYLKQMSLPSRGEVISMAERLTRVEMALDDLDAKLDEVLDHLKAAQAKE
ncbi:MAG: hypothetical protein JXA14_07545 [Anaerolineae bacterium]|nr:hypothetical protein [Anaerolineae bacterium]